MESRNHNIILYLKSGNIEYYAKIGDLEEELAGQFYRIHRGYLINLFHVEAETPYRTQAAHGRNPIPILARINSTAAMPSLFDTASLKGKP